MKEWSSWKRRGYKITYFYCPQRTSHGQSLLSFPVFSQYNKRAGLHLLFLNSRIFSCIYLNRRSSTAILQTIFLSIKLDAMAEGKLGPCMQCVRVMLLVFIAFFWVSYNVFRFTAFRINNVYYIDLEALCQLMHTYLLWISSFLLVEIQSCEALWNRSSTDRRTRLSYPESTNPNMLPQEMNMFAFVYNF